MKTVLHAMFMIDITQNLTNHSFVITNG